MGNKAAQLFEEGKAALERFDYTAVHEAFSKALPLLHQVGDVLGKANASSALARLRWRAPITTRRGEPLISSPSQSTAELARRAGGLFKTVQCAESAEVVPRMHTKALEKSKRTLERLALT